MQGSVSLYFETDRLDGIIILGSFPEDSDISNIFAIDTFFTGFAEIRNGNFTLKTRTSSQLFLSSQISPV